MLSLLRNTWVRYGLYLAIGYLGLLAMLLFFENKLIYHPAPGSQWMSPPPNGSIQDVHLTCADGTAIHAWWCPAKNSKQAMLYLHGNGGNLSQRGWSIVEFRDALDASVLIIDYPGYGKSEGRPSEQGCYQAADAAYAWLTDEKKFLPKNILLFGTSLGGGVAVELASRKDHRALILVKTFTSMPDMADTLYWWLPAPKRLLMSNQFNSLKRIKEVHSPVFIAHGDADRMIPHAQGVKLFDAAHEPKEFLSLEGIDHNDGLPEAFFTSLKAFLRKHAED
jgi:uncharacterized protein